jgi:hypothetical protein
MPLYHAFLSGFKRPEAPRATPAPLARPASPTPDTWLPLVASPSPIVASPPSIAVSMAQLMRPVASHAISAPVLSPAPAPEDPQPQTPPAEAKKPAGKPKTRTGATPKRTTRSQSKAAEAKAAKIHGLDASLIIGSRLRSGKMTKTRR